MNKKYLKAPEIIKIFINNFVNNLFPIEIIET